jgi:hypothetical protein
MKQIHSLKEVLFSKEHSLYKILLLPWALDLYSILNHQTEPFQIPCQRGLCYFQKKIYKWLIPSPMPEWNCRVKARPFIDATTTSIHPQMTHVEERKIPSFFGIFVPWEVFRPWYLSAHSTSLTTSSIELTISIFDPRFILGAKVHA